MTARGEDTQASKQVWRRRLMAAREAQTSVVRATRAAALTVQVVRLASGMAGPICAYLPVGTEPGSPAMLDAMCSAAHEVLLPVVPEIRGPLEWARYQGELTDGPFGLREPTGPRLGIDAISRAALVLVPALAADRAGTRLGRGAGHYDRSLPFATPGTPLVVMLNDEELVDALPVEAHDRPMTAALLPGAGLVPLGNSS